jgi:conjugative transfer pilus assembly protein TraH
MLKIFRTLTIFMFLFFCMSIAGEAGWLDDWYEQSISSAPSYIKGQQRGYFTLGSFSARVSTESFNPITINPPKIKAGCGGIDIFMGGVGFVNFDYLVQKVQNLIQAAPYVAFQIALKTISQKLGGIMDVVEQTINLLNSLQFDECKFLEGFMVKTWETGDIGTGLAEGLKKSGINTFHWKKVIDDLLSGKENAKIEDTIKGCPNNIKEILTNLERKGLIDHLAREKGYNDPDFKALMRGAIGDLYVRFSGDNMEPEIVYVEPCGDFFNDLRSKKKVKVRYSWNANCTIYDFNAFILKVRQDLKNLHEQMQSKGGALTNPNTRVLDPKKTPLPVYMIIKTAIMVKDSALVEVAAEPIAMGYLRNAMAEMMSEVYSNVQRAFSELTQARSREQDEMCKIPQITKDYLEKLDKNYYNAMISMHNAFTESLNELNALIDITKKFENFYEIAAKQLALKFGVFPASKVLSGS